MCLARCRYLGLPLLLPLPYDHCGTPDATELTAEPPEVMQRPETMALPGALPRPWGPSSSRIAVHSFGFWEGSSGFEADRSELTPAQLDLLDGLRRIPTPEGFIVADLTSYWVDITDSGGRVVSYRAAATNVMASDEPDLTLPTLDIDTLEPFLETFQCLSASATRDRFGTTPSPEPPMDPSSEPDVGAPAGSELPVVSTASPGCFHGIFAPVECHDTWLRLQVEVAGIYQLSALDCFEQLEIAAFGADGSSELGSASGAGGSCPVLTQEFAAPGTYPVVLRKTNLAGCGAPAAAGDFTFRVLPQPAP